MHCISVQKAAGVWGSSLLGSAPALHLASPEPR